MAGAYEKISIARKVQRPSATEFIEDIFDNFITFHGDRYYADDKSVVGGIATLDNMPVTVIGVQKGHSVKENVKRNFGSPNPEGYRKALRLMKHAEKFNRPVITFVNTPGAFCGIGAEERGEGEAIARSIMEMARLKVPVISIFIGEGGSGGALALAVADEVWMLENGMYAVLSPEGFASKLWKDSARAAEASELMKLTAEDLFELKVIEKIIPEEESGIENNLSYTTSIIKKELIKKIGELKEKDIDTLIEERYKRFRKFGEFTE